MHVSVQFPQNFFEELVLFPLYLLGSFIINELTIYARIYFWAFPSVSLTYVSVFSPVTHCFDYYSSIVSFEIRKCDTSSFVLYQECFDPTLSWWLTLTLSRQDTSCSQMERHTLCQCLNPISPQYMMVLISFSEILSLF